MGRDGILKGILGTLLAGWLSVAAGLASSPPLILEKLSTRDGLPQGTVMATLQDSQGFVWMGTEDGLVRFDGHEISRYAYSPNSTGGLPGNFVDGIAEDKQGDLWIAIKGGGLAHWHRATDSFTVYRHDPRSPNSLSSDAVRTVLVDNAGLIWVGTLDAGINILEPTGGKIRHVRHDSSRVGSLADDQVQTVLQDHSGAIWVGTHGGLDRSQPDAETFVHYSLREEPNGASGAQISQIVEDGAEALWIGTFDAGLYRIDRHGNVIAHFRHDAALNASLSNNDVRAILDDHAGHLWVGTSDGLDLFNRGTSEFSHYRHEKTDPDALSDSFIMSLYQDTTGLVWIGTYSGGVNRWNPHSWELGAARPDWLDGKLVTAFADAGDNRLWISSLGGGLVQFDADTGNSATLDSILHQHNVLRDPRVMSLHQDRHGALWIGTMADGLKKLSHERLVSIPVQPGDQHSLSAPGIMAIFEARDGSLWIGTHGGGADVLDPVTGIVRQLPFGSTVPGALSAKNITSFVEDREGNIWIGTESGGLNLARANGSVVKVFKHDPKSPFSLSANTVYSLTMDTNGRIWIGTDGGGLDLVVGTSATPDSIRFRSISRVDGLSSETIYGVLPDSSGHLWLSGNAGLMRYEPSTKGIKTYHHERGLQGEEFNFGAYFRARDGRICFGGPGGFNVFDPARLDERRVPPRLALTHVEVLGAPLHSVTPYWFMKQINLNYRASIVSLDFSALDFTSMNRNQLAYRMVGLTDDWISLGPLRRVTLTNLQAGDHVLEVRAENADAVWSATPLRLVLHKEAAPWQSKPAFGAYGVLLFGLIVLGFRAQQHKFRQALATQQSLESEVALRTYELRETNRQLVDANEAKSNFLARMGHELRTPMNGVVGMIELLARSPLSALQARQTQTIRSSAQMLLQILNDLLDLSKIQVGRIELEHLPIDFVQICEECVILFSGVAETKGLDLIVCPPPGEHVNVLGDPLRIRQILMNLIGNAVKFTERGEVVVTCDIDGEKNGEVAVRLTVADTGIGMTEAVMAKIFEPFTQADETTTRRFGGTGLGLSICHKFTQLMGGSITVMSVPQAGSTFGVLLKLKVAASREPRDMSMPAGSSARILTRRPALGESLMRYLSAFGTAALGDVCDSSGFGLDDTDTVVVDADSCPEALERFRQHGARAQRKLIVLASATAIETQGVEAFVRADQILRKPFTRDALRAALQSVAHIPIMRSGSDGIHVRPALTAQGHVLVVEDERINAAVAEGYLAELGCTSVAVENGAAAVARSAVERFDIILMDLNMPGLDGYAAAGLIRKSELPGSRIPIIALTANDADAYRDLCLLAGMDDILTKPYSLAECAEVLRRWVRCTRAQAPRAGPPGSALPGFCAVDPATVASLAGLQSQGEAHLYATLVKLFEDSSAASVEQIRQALIDHDAQTAGSLCHKLKGAAGNVGAFAFADLLGQLERSCIAANAADAWNLYKSVAAARPLLLEKLNELAAQAIA